jgi:hypothetical protein
MKTMAEFVAALESIDAQLKTDQSDNLVKQKYDLLEERRDLLLEKLKPLRSAVMAMVGDKATMAATKEWDAAFRGLSATAQMETYQDAHKLAQQLTGVLRVQKEQKEAA